MQLKTWYSLFVFLKSVHMNRRLLNWNEIQTHHSSKELSIRTMVPFSFWWYRWQKTGFKLGIEIHTIGIAFPNSYKNSYIPILYFGYSIFNIPFHFFQCSTFHFSKPLFLSSIFPRHRCEFVPFIVFSRQIVYKNWSNERLDVSTKSKSIRLNNAKRKWTGKTETVVSSFHFWSYFVLYIH